MQYAMGQAPWAGVRPMNFCIAHWMTAPGRSQLNLAGLKKSVLDMPGWPPYTPTLCACAAGEMGDHGEGAGGLGCAVGHRLRGKNAQ